MTLVIDTPLVTKSELDEAPLSAPRVPLHAPKVSASELDADPEVLRRARHFSENLNHEPAQRLTLLGVILASVENATFEQSAALLDTKPQRLEAYIHGVAAIPGATAIRWAKVAEIIQNVHQVITPEATGRWLSTEIPALGNKTPLQAVAAGKVDLVLDVTRTYLDPSFS